MKIDIEHDKKILGYEDIIHKGLENVLEILRSNEDSRLFILLHLLEIVVLGENIHILNRFYFPVSTSYSLMIVP